MMAFIGLHVGLYAFASFITTGSFLAPLIIGGVYGAWFGLIYKIMERLLPGGTKTVTVQPSEIGLR